MASELLNKLRLKGGQKAAILNSPEGYIVDTEVKEKYRVHSANKDYINYELKDAGKPSHKKGHIPPQGCAPCF